MLGCTGLDEQTHGSVAEWSKAPVSKTGIPKRYREFESLRFRKIDD